MLEQAQEHAESLAAESSLERDRLNAQQQNIARQQNNVSAANALREAALKQQGLLGTQRIQNESDSISARSALDQAKTDALNKKNNTDSNLKDDVHSGGGSNEVSKNPSIFQTRNWISRFPMLSPKRHSAVAKGFNWRRWKSFAAIPAGSSRPIIQATSWLILKAGTNTDEAVSGLKRYMTPTPDRDCYRAGQQPSPPPPMRFGRSQQPKALTSCQILMKHQSLPRILKLARNLFSNRDNGSRFLHRNSST